MLAAEPSRAIWRERLENGLGLEARVLRDDPAAGDGAEPGQLAIDQALPMLGASLTVSR